MRVSRLLKLERPVTGQLAERRRGPRGPPLPPAGVTPPPEFFSRPTVEQKFLLDYAQGICGIVRSCDPAVAPSCTREQASCVNDSLHNPRFYDIGDRFYERVHAAFAAPPTGSLAQPLNAPASQFVARSITRGVPFSDITRRLEREGYTPAEATRLYDKVYRALMPPSTGAHLHQQEVFVLPQDVTFVQQAIERHESATDIKEGLVERGYTPREASLIFGRVALEYHGLVPSSSAPGPRVRIGTHLYQPEEDEDDEDFGGGEGIGVEAQALSVTYEAFDARLGQEKECPSDAKDLPRIFSDLDTDLQHLRDFALSNDPGDAQTAETFLPAITRDVGNLGFAIQDKVLEQGLTAQGFPSTGSLSEEKHQWYYFPGHYVAGPRMGQTWFSLGYLEPSDAGTGLVGPFPTREAAVISASSRGYTELVPGRILGRSESAARYHAE
ncbi:MAG: hypothetical protein KGJ23_08250 [Euryarchaeota archaeon]|nr:hypothetical protein [Euryarchaeota archaeon]MDE1836593.1 hypothetical protein [Euryarchaeota archaeon]MDE1879212.1 hypothetical protein [Euryarchaeota archaeon]MDE2044563.1 hypothetical protein [Thermoplasmata archaeon]